MLWGYSTALDLLDECDLSGSARCSGDGEQNHLTLNALLVGQNDNRHVLKTLAKRYIHDENVKMNIYICESLIENIARDMLFLLLALEPPENLGLAEKTKFFTELYGNTLIRPATANYLTTASYQLLDMVTDLDYSEKLMPAVSFDLLKHKERDQLEILFKFWASRDESFDILKSWDQRLRKSLAARYDARDGVFDWDYHMRYKSYGAGTLNMQEYKRFRERGISFYSDDTDPCISNKTLGFGFMSGSKIIGCGYLGDIVTGPYPTYGFECEDPKMLEKVNGYPKRSATDITYHNIMRTFYEIANQKPFTVQHPEDESYALLTLDDSNRLQIKRLPEEGELNLRKPRKKLDIKLIQIDNFQINFLPITAVKEGLKKSKFENFFDIVSFPQVMVLKYLTPDIVKTVRAGGKIIVDTPKYMLDYRKEDLEKFRTDVEDLMKQNCCETLNRGFSYDRDDFMRFRVVN